MLKVYKRNSFIFIFFSAFFCAPVVRAQVMNWQETHRGSVYFEVGYNKQWYQNSTIHINQPSFNNSYSLLNVAGSDQGDANSAFAPSHYNFKFGYVFNYNQNAGLEIAYDPFRYYIPNNQKVHFNGTFDKSHFDTSINFLGIDGYHYNIQDGFGSILLSFVKRFGIYRKISHKFALDLTTKIGAGAIMSNSANSFGKINAGTSGSMSGNELAAAVGFKWTTHRHYFMELEYKFEYIMLDNIQVDNGMASQNVSSGKLTLSAGYTFSLTKHNPLFTKGWPHRKEVRNPKPMYRTEEDY